MTDRQHNDFPATCNVTIIGDGAMGTVLARHLHAKGHRVTWWSAFPDYADHLASHRENTKYLPGFSIPSEINITADMSVALESPDVIVNAVPTQFIRSVFQKFDLAALRRAMIVSVTKGVENGTLLRPAEILTQIVGPDIRLVALSGPFIAREVALGQPATLVAAANTPEYARRAQAWFASTTLRVYTNDDIVGVELAGATKNVIAIAAGVIDGMNAGDNCKAALLTRGLVEITRLGLALGADARTFGGLAGLGDLVTTCISPHGRNRRLGEMIGRGMTLEQAQATMNSVVEGVATTRSVVDLAGRLGVEMPITQAVYDVLFHNKTARQAIADLMARQPREEF